ncbi:MAG: phosphatase PAP2 family protein [Bacteroidales bacterium]|nr:phosphatase PAP2 family protein [Bacteroidales bacterium]
MKKASVYIAILLLTVSCPMANAQRSDTLRCHSTHAFTWQQSIAPAALIGTGTAISFTPLHTHFDDNINNWLQHDGHPRFEVENYLQYTTLASVFILKACNIESRHSWRDLVCLEAGASIFAFSINTGLKHALHVERPYDGVYNSFPSGHTVTAFLGAEILRREYGEEYPAIAVAGYTVATGIGVMRMYNNRHWASDVLAGAGIGILSASLMYWLAPYLTF